MSWRAMHWAMEQVVKADQLPQGQDKALPRRATLKLALVNLCITTTTERG